MNEREEVVHVPVVAHKDASEILKPGKETLNFPPMPETS